MAELLHRYIRIEPGFQKSVNLAYDLSDEEKIIDFIPSLSSIEIIEKLILGTYPNSVDRAHILIGPYGKGKSHIVLVLLSLLKDKNKQNFVKILKEIKKYSIDLYDYVISYLDSDRKLLPVIIQGSNNSLNQSFLAGIQTALKEADLSNFMPDTHFQSAIKHIENWQNNYPDALDKFSKLILPQTVEEFIVKLKEFDSESYENFVEIYPQLSAGGVFNPFGGVDVVELYSNVIKSIKAKGYNGIFLVYDEFSKYLESNIKDTSISDIKMLQDFAEKCNRSKDEQLHLLLISHKDIENYIDELPKNKIDGWRGVSERFSHIEMNSNYGQIYEIMGKAIAKTPEFYSEFKKNHEELFQKLTTYIKKQKLFSDLVEEQQNEICKDCYPLHPITTFILPRLSELVAQNERTLFTFISDSGKNTLSYILNFPEKLDSEEPLVTPDFVYDYFEPLLKKELYTSEIYKLYSTVRRILINIKDDPLQCKIVKDLALIYIINQFQNIEPLPYTIYNLFPSSKKNNVLKAIEDLENKSLVLYAKKSNGYLRLKSPSSKNIQEYIKNEIAKIKTRERAVDILHNYANDIYLYPTSYNEEHAIVRYFEFRFISADDILDVENWNLRVSMSNADGVIYAALPVNSEQIKKVKEYLLTSDINSKQAVFVLPKSYRKIDDIVFKYQATINLLSDFANDEVLVSELEIIKEDLQEVIDSFIESYIRPELGKSEFINSNKLHNIFRKSHLSSLLSEICNSVFNKTPIINNETINKNEISATTNNSRAKVIKGLLKNELEPKLGLGVSGQEGAIARSLLVETGIIENFAERPIIVEDIRNINIKNVILKIQDFFESCATEKKTFADLYKTLTSYICGIGLRRGVIPVYIAVVLHKLLGQITIYSQDKEVELSDKLLIGINSNPDLYSVRYQNWDQCKIDYLNGLNCIFSEYLPNKQNISNSYNQLCSAMQKWFMSLPKYSRESKIKYINRDDKIEISKIGIKFVSSLKNFTLNSFDFIFLEIPEIFKTEISDKNLVSMISSVKSTYDNLLIDLISGIISDLKSEFNEKAPQEASLTSLVKDWFESLNQNTKSHVFDSFKRSFLDQCSNPGNDDVYFVYSLAKTVSGLRIEDWSIDTVTDFLNHIFEFKKSVNEFNLLNKESYGVEKNTYILTSIDSFGNQVNKTFEHVQYSDMAKLLKNEIMNSLEEMGQAISDAEKRQVLIEALKTLC